MTISKNKIRTFLGSAVVAIIMFAAPSRGQVATPVQAPVARPVPVTPPPLPSIPQLPAPVAAPIPAAPAIPAAAPIKAAPPARAAGGGGCSSYEDCQIEEHRHAHPHHNDDCDKPENIQRVACRWDRGYLWAKKWDVKNITTCQQRSSLEEVVTGCSAYVRDNH
jgi:hypothetical protein